MATEQTKARKPTKNEQRRARKKQSKLEVRLSYYPLPLLPFLNVCVRGLKPQHQKPPTMHPRLPISTMRAQTYHFSPYNLPRTTRSRMFQP
jgi:hypothetical protein